MELHLATDLIETKGFVELPAADLKAYAHQRANAIGLGAADAYFSGVLENLTALQAHAAILAARFEADRSSHAGL